MENQCETKIKTLRTDNGKEYMNEKLKNVIDAAGIHRETSIAYNPQQNGRAERINRILLDKARCMLAESKLTKSFWAEAIATAVFLSNRSPKESLNGATPEECWTGEKPDLSFLKVFGSKAYSYVPSQFRSKLEPKTRPCIMVGYCQNQKGYRLWDPQQEKVISARDPVFQELENEKNPRDCIYLPVSEPMDTNQPLNSDVAPTQREDDAHATEQSENLGPETAKTSIDPILEEGQSSSDEEEATNLKRSQRAKKRPKRLDDFVLYSHNSDIHEPQNFEESMAISESRQW